MVKYLTEVKNRLFLTLLSWVTTLVISYVYKESVLFVITQSYYNLVIKNANLITPYFIFTEITEIFTIYTTLTFFIAFQIGVISFCYHSFVFFSSAFFKTEYFQLKKLSKLLFITALFSGLISNYFLIPVTWDFFASFQNLSSFQIIDLYFEAKLSDYIKFYISLYYICFFYFQIFIFLLCILNYSSIMLSIIQKYRKVYYYIFLILTTMVTPPDIFSQLFSTMIFIFFYETSLFFSVYKNYQKSFN